MNVDDFLNNYKLREQTAVLRVSKTAVCAWKKGHLPLQWRLLIEELPEKRIIEYQLEYARKRKEREIKRRKINLGVEDEKATKKRP